MAVTPNITVIDAFDGTGTLDAADGWVETLDNWTEGTGVANPTTSTVESAISYATTLTEVTGSSSLDTKGIKFRVTLGAMTAGTELRIFYRATSSANVTSDRYYVKIKKGSLTVLTDLANDEIELWKIVSGTHTQITANTYDGIPTLKENQSSYGDLRNYVIADNSVLTIIAVLDQHILQVGLDDRDGLSAGLHSEFIQNQYVDAALAGTGTTYIGLWNPLQASNSNTVKQVAASLGVAKFANIATGTSTGAQGSRSDPYKYLTDATGESMIANVGAGEIGFIEPGTYTEQIYYHSIGPEPASGTSWEDQVIFTATFAVSGAAITQRAGLFIRDTATKAFTYIRWMNIAIYGSTGVNVDSQTNGVQPDHIAMQDLHVYGNASVTSTFIFGRNDNITGVFDGYNHIMDCYVESNGINGGANGMYLNFMENSVVEHNRCYNNAGDGLKIEWSTTGSVNDNAITRYNRCWQNSRYHQDGTDYVVDAGVYLDSGAGINAGSGLGMIVYSNKCYDNSIGINIYSETDGCLVFNNLCYSNWSGGLKTLGTDTGLYYNNTMAFNGVGYSHSGGGYAFKGVGPIANNVYKNNISWGNRVADYIEEDVAGTPTGETFDYNLGEFTAAFYAGNGVNSDPLFAEEGAFNLRLKTSSPAKVAGLDLSATIPAIDYASTPRPQGALWAIGAFEFPNPATNPPVMEMSTSYAGSVSNTIDLGDIQVSDPDGNAIAAYFNVTGSLTVTFTPSGTCTKRGGA